MNQVAVKLLKYVVQCCKYKDFYYCQGRARGIWEKYSERSIDKAMKHSACTSLPDLERLAKTFHKELNKP